MKFAEQIATSTEQISGQIQTLNSTVDKLYKAYEANSGIVDLNTLVTALAGLVGVIVGALISYLSTRHINDQASKARFAIQRKNLIFSKIFKELAALKNFVSQLPPGTKYIEISTPVFESRRTYEGQFYINNSFKSRPDYSVWSEIKKDVRKTQVPKGLTDVLDRLEQSVIAYFTALETFERERSSYEKSNNSKMIEAYQATRQNHNTVFNVDFRDAFSEGVSVDDIVERNRQAHKLDDATVLEMRPIVEAVMAMDTRNNVFTQYDLFVQNLDAALGALDSLIQSIVDKYEYGNSIS